MEGLPVSCGLDKKKKMELSGDFKRESQENRLLQLPFLSLPGLLELQRPSPIREWEGKMELRSKACAAAGNPVAEQRHEGWDAVTTLSHRACEQ